MTTIPEALLHMGLDDLRLLAATAIMERDEARFAASIAEQDDEKLRDALHLAIEQRNEARAEVERLREALEHYADPKNYYGSATADGWKRANHECKFARAALRGKEEK